MLRCPGAPMPYTAHQQTLLLHAVHTAASSTLGLYSTACDYTTTLKVLLTLLLPNQLQENSNFIVCSLAVSSRIRMT